jgi:phosphate:Na+ symporter
MTVYTAVFLVFSVLGGLALFLLGMSIMTDGLRTSAGEHIRVLLAKATRNRFSAITMGTVLGFLVHSSAATVMTVGFVNAGLMSLGKAVPLIFGANIGTTLSMQLISLQLADYALAAVAIGFLVQMFFPQSLVRNLGRALMGFGLLFLGMDIMGGTIEPHREALGPWLARVDGSTWSGMVLGILAAALVTGIIQSSGATIGMVFVLIASGVYTRLEQVYPIVLGAHIGTCATALIAAIGANAEARHSAIANLAFNFFNVALAVLAAPLFIRAMALVSDDLIRQTANLHTAVMLTAAILLLPFSNAAAQFIRKIFPSREKVPASSYLDPELIPKPEKALAAVLQELGRCSLVCEESYENVQSYLEVPQRRVLRKIEKNENTINEIKPAVKNYLAALTRRYLSRRQALFVQYLTHMMADIERIGDHIKSLVDISLRQARNPAASFQFETREQLDRLMEGAGKVLQTVRDSLHPENPNFEASARDILRARNDYDKMSSELQSAINDKVARHETAPVIGLFFSEYVLALDRLVRHCKMIAHEQRQPFFGFKPAKLERVSPERDGPAD